MYIESMDSQPDGQNNVTKPNLDEWIDRYVHRPVANRIVRLLLRTSVTPNQVTLTAAFFGLLGGIVIAHATATAMWVGGVMLWWALLLDCVDGQLARARGGGTLVGRVLDGLADLVIASSGHLGLLMATYSGAIPFCGDNASGWSPFLWMLAAGASMIVHANLVDYHKGRYLELMGATTAAIHALPEAQAAHRNATGRFEKYVLRFYVNYCAFQQTLAGTSRRLPNSSHPLSPKQRQWVEQILLKPTQALAWLGPSTRMVVFVLCVWSAQLGAGGLELYLFFGLGVANFGGFWIWLWMARSAAKLAKIGVN